MRISDWSSDVCSSDLLSAASVPGAAKRRGQERRGQEGRGRKERQGLGRLRDGAAAVYTATGRAASFKHLICLGFPQPVWRRDRFSVCPWLGRLVTEGGSGIRPLPCPAHQPGPMEPDRISPPIS